MPLAELNISTWKIDPSSEVAKEFYDRVEAINSLAERSEGFIWRLVEDPRDENGRNAVCDGHDTLYTLSVWQDVGHLERFVWNTVHKKVYQGKNKWFAELSDHHLVMWNVESGVQPTLEDARERLDHLNEHGNSDFAFEWGHLPHVKLWQQQQCG